MHGTIILEVEVCTEIKSMFVVLLESLASEETS